MHLQVEFSMEEDEHQVRFPNLSRSGVKIHRIKGAGTAGCRVQGPGFRVKGPDRVPSRYYLATHGKWRTITTKASSEVKNKIVRRIRFEN